MSDSRATVVGSYSIALPIWKNLASSAMDSWQLAT